MICSRWSPTDVRSQTTMPALFRCANNYFEQVNSEQIEKMQSDLQMPFHYLNLNPQQSILFFSEEPDGGWEAFGQELYPGVS